MKISTFELNAAGKLVPADETPCERLAVGQIVTYEDMANPRKEFAVLGDVPAGNWTRAGSQRVLCLEDGHESEICGAGNDGHAGWQLGNRVLSSDELLDAIKIAGENKARIETERAAAGEVEKQRKAAERAKWAGELSFLKTTGDGKTSSHSLGAKNIKRELSRAFPGVKFSVISDSYTGGDSISVAWDLGPMTADVEKITGKYQEGSFDGMTDSYDYNHKNQWPDIYGGAKYVSENRHCPEKIWEQIGRGLCALQRKEYAGQWTRGLMGENDTFDLGSHCHQLFAKTTWPNGAEFDRVESSRTTKSFEFHKAMHEKYGDGWLNDENFVKYSAAELAGIESMRAEWHLHWCKIVFKSTGGNEPTKVQPEAPAPTTS